MNALILQTCDKILARRFGNYRKVCFSQVTWWKLSL